MFHVEHFAGGEFSLALARRKRGDRRLLPLSRPVFHVEHFAGSKLGFCLLFAPAEGGEGLAGAACLSPLPLPLRGRFPGNNLSIVKPGRNGAPLREKQELSPLL